MPTLTIRNVDEATAMRFRALAKGYDSQAECFATLMDAYASDVNRIPSVRFE